MLSLEGAGERINRPIAPESGTLMPKRRDRAPRNRLRGRPYRHSGMTSGRTCKRCGGRHADDRLVSVESLKDGDRVPTLEWLTRGGPAV